MRWRISKMRKLKKIFLYFLLMNFIQGIYGYLYPDNGWPASFSYNYGLAVNPKHNEDNRLIFLK